MESLPEELGPLLVEQLREQMNNMAAAVQLLTPMVREKGGPRYGQYLAIMNQSLYRMMRMVSNMEYAQLPEGEVALQEGPLDLAGLCRKLCGQVEPLAAKAGVRFSYDGERESLLTCGDETLLLRMLLNLVSNALRAAGRGGEAGLRLAAGRDRATLTVWDSGPGLEEFEREERPLLYRPAGLGLGLGVARRIARLHGGAIVFEQQEDRGLRAIVSLPLRPPTGDVVRTPRMSLDAHGGFSPVLVELAGVLPYQAFFTEDLE